MNRNEMDPPLTAEAQAEFAGRAAVRDRSTRLLEPLLIELAEVGYPVDDVWDLVESKDRYRAAIPVLVSWIPRVADDPPASDWLLRAIGKPWAKEAVPALIEEFPRHSDQVRWLIADGLGKLWRYAPTEPLAEYMLDPQWRGGARVLLLHALGKQANKKEAARAAVIAAVSDPVIGGNALQWIIKRDLPVGRALIEPFLEDDRAWVRADAKRILDRPT